VLARQTDAAVGVETCWSWENAATLPSTRDSFNRILLYRSQSWSAVSCETSRTMIRRWLRCWNRGRRQWADWNFNVGARLRQPDAIASFSAGVGSLAVGAARAARGQM